MVLLEDILVQQDQPSEEVADEVRQAGLTSDQLRGMMRQMVRNTPPKNKKKTKGLAHMRFKVYFTP
eukprot:4757114-Amphidinium_carterae.1